MLAFSAVRVSLPPYPRLKTFHLRGGNVTARSVLVVQRARRKAEDAPVRDRVVLVLVWFAPTRDVRPLRRANDSTFWSPCPSGASATV